MHLLVLEGNTSARHFYERLGGEEIERAMKRLPDGGTHLVCRNHWRDLSQLVAVPSAME